MIKGRLLLLTLLIMPSFALDPIEKLQNSFLSVGSKQQQQSDSSQPSIMQLSDHEYKLGAITINSQSHEIMIPGKINMQRGMIELLACAQGGKVHESVLLLDLVPYHLHVALLLLGLNYGGGLDYQGDPRSPKGDSVEIWVKWKSNGNDTIVRGEDLVWDIPRNRSMERTPWVFIGSKIMDGQYMADIDKSIITTFHDPLTILDNPLRTGGDDELYKVNEELVPTKGTPVMVIIRKIK